MVQMFPSIYLNQEGALGNLKTNLKFGAVGGATYAL
jgi:hypothetical protein